MAASAGVADWPDTAAEGVVFLRQRERDLPDMEVERALDPVGLAQLAITAGDLSCNCHVSTRLQRIGCGKTFRGSV
jgi:hypothetical protein